MKFKIFLFLFSLLLTLSFGSFEQVLACSCSAEKPVCAAFGDAKAVFVGEVTKGKSPERMSDAFELGSNELNFVFKVKESFLGAETGKEISIETGMGFGDCGFSFQKGEMYLVYAYEHNGKLRTSVCARTKHISRVNVEDFDFLRNLTKQNAGGRIYGNVTQFAKSSFEENSKQPMRKLKIQVERTDKKAKNFEAVTDENGNYELSGLKTGKYKITPLLPKYLKLNFLRDNDDFLLNEYGCAEKNLLVENRSLVFVRVVDSDGKPVDMIQVEFIPVDVEPKTDLNPFFYEEFGVTNPQGGFYNFGIPPGKYTASVNYLSPPDKRHPFPTTFYPGTSDRAKAKVIEVRLGTQIENLVIQLPARLAAKEIKGTVYWADGTPASDIQVYIVENINSRYCINDCHYKTDSEGKFLIIGYEGRTYRVVAKSEKSINNETQVFKVESEPFITNDKLPVLKLSLNQKKE